MNDFTFIERFVNQLVYTSMRAKTHLVLAVLLSTATIGPAQEDTSSRKRAISDNLASALADTMPKFNPPTAEELEAEKNFFDDLPQPKNGIIRLPTVVVEGNRPAVFTEREINTDKGLKELAVKRYFSEASLVLNKFYIPYLTKSSEEIAMQMWQEDERLRLMTDLDEQAENARQFGDEAAALEIKALSNDALGRRDYLPKPTALSRD